LLLLRLRPWDALVSPLRFAPRRDVARVFKVGELLRDDALERIHGVRHGLQKARIGVEPLLVKSDHLFFSPRLAAAVAEHVTPLSRFEPRTPPMDIRRPSDERAAVTTRLVPVIALHVVSCFSGC